MKIKNEFLIYISVPITLFILKICLYGINDISVDFIKQISGILKIIKVILMNIIKKILLRNIGIFLTKFLALK